MAANTLEVENSMVEGEPENTDGKVFIGGLSWETTSDSLRYYFEKFGELSDVALMADKRTGQPRGFGFVSYKDPAAVDIVLAQPSHNIDGRTVDVKRAVPRSQAPAPTSGRQESRKIFVGGLSPEVDEKEFNEYFTKFGPLQDSIVMYDKKTNRSRGFGFVTFETEEGVQAVLSSEHEIMGKWVEIKRAEPRDMSRNSSDMGTYGGYRHDGERGPMRGGMGGRGGYDDYAGSYSAQYMGGRGGGYGYGYGGESNYAGGGGSMGGRGSAGGQGYMAYGYGGSSMPTGGYYGQASGGVGSYAGYGSSAGLGPQSGGYRGPGYGAGAGLDRGSMATSSREASSAYGPGYGAGAGRPTSGGQAAGWTSGYGGATGTGASPRQDGGYPDYRSQGGVQPGGRQDRQFRPY